MLRIEEEWKGDREYWHEESLTESSPVECRWVSSEHWTDGVPEEKGLKSFVRERDIFVSYSVFDRAREKLKDSPELRRIGRERFYEEKYICGDVVVVYANRHTFNDRGAAFTFQASTQEAIKKLAFYLGLPINA